MAWAFYGHRQQLYRETKPHMGYWMLRDWARAMPAGYFVVTSNVDGQFETAGFAAERILEQHGNIHRYQCSRPCGSAIWQRRSAGSRDRSRDAHGAGPVAAVPGVRRGGAAERADVRGSRLGGRTSRSEQEQRYRQWLASVRGKQLVILELGAGTAIATIRMLGREARERSGIG